LLGVHASTAWSQGSDQPISLSGTIAGGGINYFAPDKWALVKGHVRNESDEDRVLRLVWHFGVEPSRQFVRRVWVPARTQRMITWPARLATLPPKAKVAEGTGLLLEEDAEVSFGDQPGSILAMEYERLTSMVSGGDDTPVDGVLAARLHRGLPKSMNYPPRFEAGGPRFTLGWEPVEFIVLASPELKIDSAQRRALRRWIRAGGTLWVMLDRVDNQVMVDVLGEDWLVDVVDRVSFNSVAFDVPADGRQVGNVTTDPVVDEKPFDMARVLAPDYDSLLAVRGWPALLQRRVGAGRIVITTVTPRAWIAEDAIDALNRIASVVYQEGASELKAVTPKTTDGYVDAQIGYEVIGRGQVAAVLIGYLLLFAITAGLLLYRKRGERVAPAGLILAVVAGLVLLVVGVSQRRAEQPTTAILQVVYAQPQSAVATVRGSIGLFTPFERESSLSSQRGGWVWPRQQSQDTRRLMWTDLDFWEWQNMELSGGAVHKMDFSTTTEFENELEVDARFGEDGLTAQLRWPTPNMPRDVVLITPHAAMAATVGQPDGDRASMQIDADPLPADTYVGGDVLGQQQRMHNQVIQSIRKTGHGFDRPILVGWTDLIDDGLATDENMPRRGGAMWMMPFKAGPSQVGDKVRVPWPFVKMTPLRRLAGAGRVAVLYDARRRAFVEMTFPGMAVAKFDAPDAVRPLSVESATLHMDIQAASRKVEVLGVSSEPTGPKLVTLTTLNGPTGLQVLDLDLSKVNSDGGSITLAVRVGASPNAGSTETLASMWQLKRFALEMRGTVGEPQAAENR
jgi:hypothetical protein